MCYLSKSFIALLVPAVEILSGIENKGLSSFYMSKLTICGGDREWKYRKNTCISNGYLQYMCACDSKVSRTCARLCKSTSVCQIKQTLPQSVIAYFLSPIFPFPGASPPSPASTIRIWSMQSLPRKQRSSGHDSNGLLVSLASQGRTAGLVKSLFNYVNLAFSLSLPSLTLATNHRSACSWHFHPQMSVRKDWKKCGKGFSTKHFLAWRQKGGLACINQNGNCSLRFVWGRADAHTHSHSGQEEQVCWSYSKCHKAWVSVFPLHPCKCAKQPLLHTLTDWEYTKPFLGTICQWCILIQGTFLRNTGFSWYKTAIKQKYAVHK